MNYFYSEHKQKKTLDNNVNTHYIALAAIALVADFRQTRRDLNCPNVCWIKSVII